MTRQSRSADPPGLPATAGAPPVERRQVTVLFSDIVGSSAFTAWLDPEDVTEIIVAYRRAATAVIQAQGGYVARFVGDGILAYWGYPQAHEDDPVRAVRAALGILQALSEVRAVARRWNIDLRLRLGVDTGVVVVGSLGDPAAALGVEVIGDAPNVAMRLQNWAEPDTALVSAATRELSKGAFEFGPQVSVHQRGERWVDAYPVRSERSERDPATAPARILAREAEREHLLRAWQASRKGAGTVLLLQGDAGIGKSTLLAALRRDVLASGGRWLETHCEKDLSRMALWPVRDLVMRAAGISGAEDADLRQVRLETALANVGTGPLRTAIEALLDFAAPGSVPPPDQTPARRLVGIAGWFAALADHAAHALVLEDVHWADLGTLQFVAELAQKLAGRRLLVVLTSRTLLPEAWMLRTGATLVALGGLMPEEVKALVRERLPARRRRRDLVEAIADKSEGNPLFAVELARLAGTSRGRAFDPMDVLSSPSTLNDYLSARLDTLGPLKATAQAASVLGRTPDPEILAAVLGIGAAALRERFDALAAADILRREEGGFAFRHALIRDAAYLGMLRAQRRDLHGLVARRMAASGEAALAQAPLVAYHFDHAGEAGLAFSWWVRAGKLAVKRGAPAEALKCFNRSIALAGEGGSTFPDDLQAEAWLARAVQTAYLRGNGDDDVETSFKTAVRISGGPAMASSPGLAFRALWGLATFQVVRGQIADALVTGDELLGLARRMGDRAHVVEGHRIHGLVSLLAGRLPEAAGHYGMALDLFDAERDADHRFEFGSDPAAIARMQLSWCQTFLGDLAAADHNAALAQARAQDLAHSHTAVHVAGVDALRHLLSGRRDTSLALCEDCLSLADRMRFSYWQAWGRLVAGMARWPDAPDRGIGEIRDGITAYEATGARQLVPYALAQLGAAFSQTESHEEARRHFGAALDSAYATGVRLYETEIHGLHARSLARRDPTRARTEWLAGLQVAEAQGALGYRARHGLGPGLALDS